MTQKEIIIKKLKDNGCRITKQRKMLIDIILENDCSCCKEIYYKALEADPNIGAATVYRMINTLEEIGEISRKNMYRVKCDLDCLEGKSCTVILDDDNVYQLSKTSWTKFFQEGLRSLGYIHDQKVRNIIFSPEETKITN